MARKETGIQFLARLGTRPSIEKIEPKLFHNGPCSKDVIELYGSEGTGKTETLLHLVASCLLTEEWKGIPLEGRNAGVIFLDTDYKFSILRLATVLERRIVEKFQQYSVGPSLNENDLETYIKNCLTKLHVVRCSDSTQLVITLHSLENVICDYPNISVIMIDSLSAFYWIDRSNGGDRLPAQENNLKLFVDTLMKIVSNYNLTLIATKSAFYKKKEGDTKKTLSSTCCSSATDFDSEHVEYLCKPWKRFVTHRLVFLKQQQTGSDIQSFIVGGDYIIKPSTFTIGDMGLVFIS